MKAADGTRIGDQLRTRKPLLRPGLVPMDMAEHESLGLGGKQRPGRELMIETSHWHAVLAHATEHRAVGHADGGQSSAARDPV